MASTPGLFGRAKLAAEDREKAANLRAANSCPRFTDINQAMQFAAILSQLCSGEKFSQDTLKYAPFKSNEFIVKTGDVSEDKIEAALLNTKGVPPRLYFKADEYIEFRQKRKAAERKQCKRRLRDSGTWTESMDHFENVHGMVKFLYLSITPQTDQHRIMSDLKDLGFGVAPGTQSVKLGQIIAVIGDGEVDELKTMLHTKRDVDTLPPPPPPEKPKSGCLSIPGFSRLADLLSPRPKSGSKGR